MNSEEMLTKKALIARGFDAKPLPEDADSAFWMNTRGGIAALAAHCLWLAGERLRLLQTTFLQPLLAQLPSGNAAIPDWQRDGQFSPENAAALWQAYQATVTHYQSLRTQFRLPLSPQPELEQAALTALDVGLRHQFDDLGDVLSWQHLSIVLPAYNEEIVIAQTIQNCLRAVRHYCPNAEVIVVDDGSRDQTGVVADAWAARDARVVVVHNRPNKGYGGALLAGFAAGRGDWLFFMDSDGQFDINQIADLLAVAVTQAPGTAVIGYRAQRKDPPLRRLNAWGWKKLVGTVVGLHGIRDIDCAFKLLPARAVRAADVQAQGAMVNTEMLVKMQHMHVPIVQVPVQHFPRTHGTATGANLRVIMKAFRELLRMRRRLRHWQPPTM
jgi:hypothetical protein